MDGLSIDPQKSNFQLTKLTLASSLNEAFTVWRQLTIDF